MKITQKKLQQIIKEETAQLLAEQEPKARDWGENIPIDWRLYGAYKGDEAAYQAAAANRTQYADFTDDRGNFDPGYTGYYAGPTRSEGERIQKQIDDTAAALSKLAMLSYDDFQAEYFTYYTPTKYSQELVGKGKSFCPEGYGGSMSGGIPPITHDFCRGLASLAQDRQEARRPVMRAR
tara:strand:+ start:805 stop:1341 length:537 start_codon:yes stop_codon:yes gene_type:complete